VGKPTQDTETSYEELRADVFSGKTLKQNLRDIIARNNTGYSYQELVDVLNSDSTDDMLEDDELESVDKTVNLLAHLYVHMAKSRDQQIALAAEIVTFKDILEAYRQTTGIDTNLFTDYLIEKIGKLSGNPLEGLITNEESYLYTKEKVDSMLKDARKRAYSRGFQTAKTVSAKKMATLKQAQEKL
jgi:hypothetical protein